ncbi:signal peptide peptidase SppA [Helicobacter ailurogastricus]|uniref:Protease IV (PspA) n=2 Tax=Helicobacter ailurogastricus TaxID=1578720 RepID=A0A0K2Y2U4_9HELI|nr:endopeptidase IV [Helicobacter ailurogastricus]GLH58433.1 Signal peptide protease IV SppA [Helicobacter ailurogastricus]GLH59872.1 Signal peptide protease IV SppA [Helicobacter ailurogastricus]GMB89449.1 Signal peptide protease IV SppA [Helicobacter ailurogastricus]CRI32301.1 protease IV (PspA) [Helicobacter ailurogastricus]
MEFVMLAKLAKVFTTPLDFITRYFKAVVLILIVLFVFVSKESTQTPSPNLAKIYLYGPIFESESLRAQVQQVLANPSVKGVLLLIDSPGGSISASVELNDLLTELRKKIPIVAYAQGVMASGSYYAGMAANTIYANRGALVGSIGVIFSGVNIQALMDKVGIKSQGLAKGAYKEVGTFTRAWTDKEKQYLDRLLDQEYQMFVGDVAKARKLDVKNAPDFAEGKIFNAKEALDLHLIDHVGTYNQAIKALQSLSHVKTPIWLQKDRFERLMDKFLQSSTQVLGRYLGVGLH